MDVDQVKKYCSSFPGAREELQGHPANILSYKVGDRKFAYFKTSDPEKWRFSIRVEPDLYIGLTDQAGIKPARYVHRFHWVTIVRVDTLPEDHLKELIRWSYHKAASALSRKVREALGA
ncbi:MmcQ/YjbR family DNA-binding protein [Microbulbifer halophilus]|uniref:MmcQ/YjbR family DNA-binding protein n=1 Tax=Microbulbifer halophilus TaxID=453963 RepID=A0ABW5E939_9GAMM|nr:MmcQ/YjbR family DNA-binding protein [Microbulbifer halophilus]MCW8126411.1 MmcQ/YjbR family DNA-binding protein [Microbulbifer halophilus]